MQLTLRFPITYACTYSAHIYLGPHVRIVARPPAEPGAPWRVERHSFDRYRTVYTSFTIYYLLRSKSNDKALPHRTVIHR